jgi:hypothetical protein
MGVVFLMKLSHDLRGQSMLETSSKRVDKQWWQLQMMTFFKVPTSDSLLTLLFLACLLCLATEILLA